MKNRLKTIQKMKNVSESIKSINQLFWQAMWQYTPGTTKITKVVNNILIKDAILMTNK